MQRGATRARGGREVDAFEISMHLRQETEQRKQG